MGHSGYSTEWVGRTGPAPWAVTADTGRDPGRAACSQSLLHPEGTQPARAAPSGFRVLGEAPGTGRGSQGRTPRGRRRGLGRSLEQRLRPRTLSRGLPGDHGAETVGTRASEPPAEAASGLACRLWSVPAHLPTSRGQGTKASHRHRAALCCVPGRLLLGTEGRANGPLDPNKPLTSLCLHGDTHRCYVCPFQAITKNQLRPAVPGESWCGAGLGQKRLLSPGGRAGSPGQG